MADERDGAARSEGLPTPSPDAVLFASYGTSRDDARAASIAPVATCLRSESFGSVRDASGTNRLFAEAYTSAKARRALERRGTPVPDVSEALHALARAGARTVLVQPGHLVYGTAFEQVRRAVEECRFLFARLVLGAPLLASDEDLVAVAQALAERHPRRTGEALVVVAHGAEGNVGSVYASLMLRLRELGRDDAYVGSMNEYPRASDVVRLVGLDRERAGIARVRLVPLMLTAAAHASRDINGSRDGSWRHAFEAAGYEVSCDLEGLGALPVIRALYAAHARAAWEETCSGAAGMSAAGAGAAGVAVPGAGAVAPGVGEASALAASARGLLPREASASEPGASSCARFPLFVDLRGTSCLVVGLGAVGMRRARTLARFGAKVLALDPSPRAENEREAASLGVRVERRDWVPADVKGMRLVVAATNVRSVNAVVARACAREGVPVSVADSAEESTCFFPALCESARLVAGVVSDGAHHGLVARAAVGVRAALAQAEREAGHE